jgi:hypothetical protein
MRSNSALRTRTKHHAPALVLRCNGLLRKGSWWASWRRSLDGMQGVRGSNPLSSTPGQRPSLDPTSPGSAASGDQIGSNLFSNADPTVGAAVTSARDDLRRVEEYAR